jgi:Gas vesicle synthesis protein GvpL/GvpF
VLTYVYCVVADTKRPSTAKRPKGLPRLSRVRLLEVDRGAMWAVVADAPADKYSARAINAGLTDLEWVSRAAVAHEAVVESFLGAVAVLPMKLFTLFTSDARALEHIADRRGQIDRALKRVAGHDEWGVRVVLDRARAVSGAVRAGRTPAKSGAGYLTRKKAQHQATAELAQRAREVVADLYDRLAAQAAVARRRSASEMPAQRGPLLLDAAFLVPRTRARRFGATVASQAKTLTREGYGVTLSGPWPPYSFMQD